MATPKKTPTRRHTDPPDGTVATDDTFDNQGSIDELELFTAAIARWDCSREKLKHYMMVLFSGIAGIYAEIESNTRKERGL
ncbi:unnamed protein product [Linum trigynum]|uniref:Terpene synthase metal-binding domain-containing protein n=1 Tax=Linum trigynum TaxID=586398 RepID=A0AAV2D4M2_9ROSI